MTKKKNQEKSKKITSISLGLLSRDTVNEILEFGGITIFKSVTGTCKSLREDTLKSYYCSESILFRITQKSIYFINEEFNYSNINFWEGCSDDDIKQVCSKIVVKLKEVVISFCTNLTDNAFKYFKGIHSLNMSHCCQETITDEAFKHLSGIKNLNLFNCHQKTITEKALEHIKGVEILDVSHTNNKMMTDKAFKFLGSVEELTMLCCPQDTITDEAFKHLPNVRSLDISQCTQNSITGKGFKYLKKIHTLTMCECEQITAPNASKYLKDIKVLDVTGCDSSLVDYLLDCRENNDELTTFSNPF